MMVSVNLIDGDTVSVLVNGSIQQIAKITSGSKIKIILIWLRSNLSGLILFPLYAIAYSPFPNIRLYQQAMNSLLLRKSVQSVTMLRKLLPHNPSHILRNRSLRYGLQ